MLEINLDHIRPWTVKDPGLGYKDYCSKDQIDALRYSVEYLCKYEGEWKGEQKMGTTLTSFFDGSVVNGGLYYRDNDGNFVKLMTVTNIEKTTDLNNPNSDLKVEGYPPFKPETVEVNDTSRKMLGSISEKYSSDDHVYFMIFDGTTFSVKIDRTFLGMTPNYSNPYRVTVYDAGKIRWMMTYQTWHDLECTFMHDVASVLNAIFSPFSIKYTISRMLRSAGRVVKYYNVDADEQRNLELMKQRETEKRRDFFNYILTNGYLREDVTIEKVIFDNPATVILWKDGTKTVVHAQDGEPYDKEKGFAMAVCKKIFGNGRDYYHVFKRWFRKGEDRSKKEEVND